MVKLKLVDNDHKTVGSNSNSQVPETRLYALYLRKRQRQIIARKSLGGSSQEIAKELGIAAKTLYRELARARKTIEFVKLVTLTPEMDQFFPLEAPIPILNLPARVNDILVNKLYFLYVRELYNRRILENGYAALPGIGPRYFAYIQDALEASGLPRLSADRKAEAWAVHNFYRPGGIDRVDSYEAVTLESVRWGHVPEAVVAKILEIGPLQLGPIGDIAVSKLTSH